MKTPSWIKKFRDWAHASPAASPAIVVPERKLGIAALTRLMCEHPGVPLLLATADTAAAEEYSAAWEVWRELLDDPRPSILIPEVSAGRQQWLPENEASRCAAMQAALAGTPALFIASASTLLSDTLAPKGFAKLTLTLKVGMTIDPEELSKRLVDLDYDHEFEVTAPGEFARRGGIMDIFSPLYADPIRIEFWGNEIDSLRFFSAASQCSTEPLKEFRVIPRGATVLRSKQELRPVREYFGKQVPLALVEPEAIESHLEEFSGEESVNQWRLAVKAAKEVVRIELPALVDPDALTAPVRDNSGAPELDVALIGEELNAAVPDMDKSGAALWHWQQLKSELLRWHQSGYELVACCSGEGEIQRFQELLESDSQTRKLPIILEHRTIPAGLLFPSARLALLSDRELFGRELVRHTSRYIEYHYDLRETNDLLELDDGALAVHLNYGICRYHGIHLKEIDGQLIEAVELEFDGEQRLFLPIDQAFLVSRYVGGSKNTPKLSKLGSTSWTRTRAKAEQAAWDLAAELLRLESMRAAAPGFQFQPAPDWERAFGSSFPYALTADQEAAVKACIADMESPKPMDRLLCGDVGYGKTEVALRAAFRAVMNGKQVAVLVPTTVLCQQHYQTFTARLAEFPVRVEMLSRFKSAAEQSDIVRRLGAGEVDIIIGTHRIISEDVRFANLGLLIIDEEQRFGVRHKQRLKALRASLDILTMTATPIPRTLYMSLSGLRNLSTIMTAPAHRLPVTTIVANYDHELIREAITREVERGGQVFFLHNRVQTIMKTYDFMKDAMPNIRFSVGHGRMEPEELERVMTDFVAHKSDVLICTTIIESGIDIPNANTIIIDHAERFGLSELYQLRGRVGRFFRQAYAYMLLPPMGVLPANARERLAAIKHFTNLGAGFRLAMKDLEIRGSGNILGAEQSGHIAAVGFDLYCQLLKNAVASLENKPLPMKRDVPVEIDFLSTSITPVDNMLQAVIPPSYITDESARLSTYKHLQTLVTPEEVDTFGGQLQDRFGALPQVVKTLLQYYRIKALAISQNWVRVAVNAGRLIIETKSGLHRINGALPALVSIRLADRLSEIELIAGRLAK